MKFPWFLYLLVSMPYVLSGVTHRVDMVGITFVPDTLTVSQNDSVLWVNTSAISHTTTSGVNGVPDGYWDSGLMAPTDSFTFYFDSVGVFPYYCTPHWTLGMVGSITVAPVGIVDNGFAVPVEFDVGQAYPNPFDRAIRIDYSLDVPTRVCVSVYGVEGRLIRILVDGALPGGRYSTLWDGRDAEGSRVAAGLYFLRVASRSKSIERKVLLLR